MKRFGLFLAVFAAVLPASGGPVLSLSPAAASAQAQTQGRLVEVLPAEGLDKSSVLVFRRQPALDPHYYLADENVLGLDGKAEAVFARYAAGSRETLLLVISYPSEEAAGRVYERFGRVFFPKGFEALNPKTVERIETGDYAAAVRTLSVLIIVLEAPDRAACEDLVRRAEAAALAYVR